MAAQSSTIIKIATHQATVYDIDAEGCETWGDLKAELQNMGSDGGVRIWDDPSLGLFQDEKKGGKELKGK